MGEIGEETDRAATHWSASASSKKVTFLPTLSPKAKPQPMTLVAGSCMASSRATFHKPQIPAGWCPGAAHDGKGGR